MRGQISFVCSITALPTAHISALMEGNTSSNLPCANLPNGQHKPISSDRFPLKPRGETKNKIVSRTWKQPVSPLAGSLGERINNLSGGPHGLSFWLEVPHFLLEVFSRETNRKTEAIFAGPPPTKPHFPDGGHKAVRTVSWQKTWSS